MNDSDSLLGGRYRILRPLGSGGFGQTYLSEDTHLPTHPQVVVKRLHPCVTDPEALQVARRLFDTEAQVLYRLGHHPQIPQLLAHFEQDRQFYLAQEYIQGRPLSFELLSGTIWDQAQVLKFLGEMLEILKSVHRENVIHRDIKPDNIMRRYQDRRLVLIDFGAVKQVSTQMQITGEITSFTIGIGTQGYMPGEQAAGQPRFSSDLYAVGMIAIQALSGVLPKDHPRERSTQEIQWQPQTPTDPRLVQILDRMVRYDFRDRYPQVDPILADLEPLMVQVDAEVGGVGAIDSPDPSPVEIENINIAATDLPTAQGVTGQGATGSEQGETEIPQPTNRSQTLVLGQGLDRSEGLPDRDRSEFEIGWKHGVAGLLSLALLGGWMAWGLRSNGDRSPTPSTQITSGVAPDPLPSDSPIETSPSPPDVETLWTEAEALRTGSQPEAALAAYQEILARDPDSAEALWGSCYALNQLEQFEQALSWCDRALEIDPQYPEAWWSKGFALESLGQDPDALAAYDRALEQDPQLQVVWGNRGVILNRLGRSQEAVQSFDRALELDPQSARDWNNRGSALLNLDRDQEALQAFNRALEQDPSFAQAWINTGVALATLKRSQEALAAYDRALEIAPDNAEAWTNRGILLMALDRSQEAVAAFDRALQIDPTLAVANQYRDQIAPARNDDDDDDEDD